MITEATRASIRAGNEENCITDLILDRVGLPTYGVPRQWVKAVARTEARRRITGQEWALPKIADTADANGLIVNGQTPTEPTLTKAEWDALIESAERRARAYIAAGVHPTYLYA